MILKKLSVALIMMEETKPKFVNNSEVLSPNIKNQCIPEGFCSKQNRVYRILPSNLGDCVLEMFSHYMKVFSLWKSEARKNGSRRRSLSVPSGPSDTNRRYLEK